MSRDFQNPVEVIFGVDGVDKIPLAKMENSLIVTTAGAVKRGLPQVLANAVEQKTASVWSDVTPNPTILDIENAVEKIRSKNVKSLIALGGGSSLDYAKALSVALANPDLSIRNILEKSISLETIQTLPWIAIPTTAGTGSEVTPFATIWDHIIHKKYSLNSPLLFAQQAYVDPRLCLRLPWLATLAPGLDAYSQAFESLWNKAANPTTRGQAIEAIRLIPDALRTLERSPSDLEARSAMSKASLLAGLAISHTRTALAHSMSYPLTSRLGLDHGFACSFTLPVIWQMNAEAAPEWAQAIATDLGFHNAEEVYNSIVALLVDLKASNEVLKVIANYDRVYDLADEMFTPGRADNMPVPVTKADIRDVLEKTQTLLFT